MSQNKTSTLAPSLQDFSLIRTYVEKFKSDNTLQTSSLAFSFFVLDLLFSLQADEIEDALTDSFYLRTRSQDSGHDRGIDALYIDGSESPSVVHLFSFKYTEDFKKTGNHFPSGEIDKILGFLSSIMQRDESLKSHVNSALYSKVEEIWSLFDSQNPKFLVHVCANYYHPFEEGEKKRFERELSKYSSVAAEYHLMPELVKRLTHRGRQIVHGRVKAIDKNLFEKAGGDIRALVVELDARDLIRLVINDEALRNRVDIDDYSLLRGHDLLEDAFEDNVRIYLKQRSRINQNIKSTALGDESYRFFFYNNGITLTCSRFEYPRNQRGPIIILENIQIVNGGQTIHALFEAFQENPEKFHDLEVLCRIYQTSNESLSTSIAEYTNSQNPVKSRDIRSNDYVQKKLEKELFAQAYYYERKKGQHQDKPRARRIDAEKVGQVLMAFFNQMPAEAKDNKRLIFAEKYDEIFNDSVTAGGVLLCLTLFSRVEQERNRMFASLADDNEQWEKESFVLHSSYYLLYLLRKIAEKNGIELEFDQAEPIAANYSEAIEMIRKATEMERLEFQKRKENYNHRVFFKGNRPKKHLDTLLNTWPDWRSFLIKGDGAP